MGFMDRLFGSKKNKRKSYIRLFVAHHYNRVAHRHDPSDDLTIKDLLVLILLHVTSFASPRPDEILPKDIEMSFDCIRDEFSNDAVLFEVGCYALYHTSTFINNNFPEKRNQIFTELADLYLKVFEIALKIREGELRELLLDRTLTYTRISYMIAGKSDPAITKVENTHSYLSQLIYRCKDNNTPDGEYKFNKGPLMIFDAHVALVLNTEILAWEKYFLPIMIDTVNTFCLDHAN